jgi:hypothetical protein
VVESKSKLGETPIPFAPQKLLNREIGKHRKQINDGVNLYFSPFGIASGDEIDSKGHKYGSLLNVFPLLKGCFKQLQEVSYLSSLFISIFFLYFTIFPFIYFLPPCIGSLFLFLLR